MFNKIKNKLLVRSPFERMKREEDIDWEWFQKGYKERPKIDDKTIQKLEELSEKWREKNEEYFR